MDTASMRYRARPLHERQRLSKYLAAARNRGRLWHVVKRIDAADALANAQLDHASAFSRLRPQCCDRDACLAELGALLQSNRLIHTVGRRLPLYDIALAHELSERSEIIGNIILDIG
jgi:NADPH:quinone reductase-like Zn-dependent oxidoreductase